MKLISNFNFNLKTFFIVLLCFSCLIDITNSKISDDNLINNEWKVSISINDPYNPKSEMFTKAYEANFNMACFVEKGKNEMCKKGFIFSNIKEKLADIPKYLRKAFTYEDNDLYNRFDKYLTFDKIFSLDLFSDKAFLIKISIYTLQIEFEKSISRQDIMETLMKTYIKRIMDKNLHDFIIFDLKNNKEFLIELKLTKTNLSSHTDINTKIDYFETLKNLPFKYQNTIKEFKQSIKNDSEKPNIKFQKYIIEIEQQLNSKELKSKISEFSAFK